MINIEVYLIRLFCLKNCSITFKKYVPFLHYLIVILSCILWITSWKISRRTNWSRDVCMPQPPFIGGFKLMLDVWDCNGKCYHYTTLYIISAYAYYLCLCNCQDNIRATNLRLCSSPPTKSSKRPSACVLSPGILLFIQFTHIVHIHTHTHVVQLFTNTHLFTASA